MGRDWEGTFARVEAHLYQARFRVGATRVTRAFAGGIGLGPARAWFYVDADHPTRAATVFSFHWYLPRWLDVMVLGADSGYRLGVADWPRIRLHKRNMEPF